MDPERPESGSSSRLFRDDTKFALGRIAVFQYTTVAVFLFLIAGFWVLQIREHEANSTLAERNRIKTVPLLAPRGKILDRDGRVIVDNVPGTAVKLWVADLPAKGRYDVIRRLAWVLDVRPVRLAQEVDSRVNDPLDPITVKTAVGEDQISYLYEHQADFPGVQIQQTYLRHYPYQSLGAQLLGYVGEVSQQELDAHPKLYKSGDKVGKTGVEAKFDQELRGEAGEAQIRVDSMGRPHGARQPKIEPRPGSAVRLTLDMGLQRAAERALRLGIQTAIDNGSYNADGGALVALDPQDGAVLAMASTPTYKPSVYVGRVDPKKIKPLVDSDAAEKANFPGINRATSGIYPPGSTWKPVTALAAMQEHVLQPYGALQCTPSATYGLDQHVFKNWDPYINQSMTLPEALARSCDTYFYQLGYDFYLQGDKGRSRMQEWARKFGFGRPTGFDLGGEQSGLIPTPAWRKKHFETDWDRAWNPGNSIQLAIGQQDIQVTPLQMARFYAMIANGGKLVTPYVVAQVEQPAARGQEPVVLRRYAPDPPESVGVDPAALQVVRDGLYQATHSPYGTSSGVFGTYPISIAGKTGTAEKVVNLPGYPIGHLEDQAWWCGYGPSDNAQLVVCAVVENGGHGSSAAAPAALRVFEKYFNQKAPGTQALVNVD